MGRYIVLDRWVGRKQLGYMATTSIGSRCSPSRTTDIFPLLFIIILVQIQPAWVGLLSTLLSLLQTTVEIASSRHELHLVP